MTKEEFEERLKPIDEKLQKMKELSIELREGVESFRKSAESFIEHLKTAPKEEIREAIREYRRMKDAEKNL